MGTLLSYSCGNCGRHVEHVSEDFDYGFSGEVVVPILCEEHGVRQVQTGLNARAEDWRDHALSTYPCPRCRRESPLWDHRTCPRCGERRVEADPGDLILWD